MPIFSTSIFAKLSTVIDREVDLEKVSTNLERVWKENSLDPMAVLVKTAESMEVTVTPMKVSLLDALWKANEDCPIVFWEDQANDWVLASKAGIFNVRLIVGEAGSERQSISRTTLQKRLKLESLQSIVEVGIVQPSLPLGRSSVDSDMARNKEMASRSFAIDEDKVSHHGMLPATRYFRTLFEDKADIVTLLIFSVIAGILYLAVPLAVDTVVSNLAYGAQNNPYYQALMVLGFVVMVSLGLQVLITGFQYYISDVIQRRIFARTTAEIAYRLPRVRPASMFGTHAPELVNRFLEVVTIQKNSAFFLLDGVNGVIASLIGMVLLALYHPFLLFFVIILLLSIVLIVWVGGKGAIETGIAESKTKYSLMNWFEEIALYPSLFKGPGGYNLASMRANQLATDYVNARCKHFSIVIRQVWGLLILSVIAAVILLLGGAWLVISQQITLGQLVASEIIMGSIIASLSKFGKKLEAWYDTMAAVDKLGHIFDVEMERQDGEVLDQESNDGGYSVMAEQLCLSYQGVGSILKQLDFNLPKGSKAVVLGSFGSGISSLLDLIFGLRRPDGGSLVIEGVDVRHWNLESLRTRVIMLRSDQILDTSVIDNLRLGRNDIGLDEVHQALKQMGLLSLFLDHPKGLQQRMQIGGANLTKGQRVAFLVARALVQKPKLILVDEIFDGLDAKTFVALSAPLRDPSNSATVIISTRNPENVGSFENLIDLTK